MVNYEDIEPRKISEGCEVSAAGPVMYLAFNLLSDPVLIFNAQGALIYNNFASITLLPKLKKHAAKNAQPLLKIAKQNSRFLFVSDNMYYECATSIADTDDKFIIVARDITGLKQKIADKEQRVHFYELILNNIPVDMVIFDEDHRYLFVNKFAIKDDILRSWVIGKDDYAYVKKRNMDVQIADRRRRYFKQCQAEGRTVEVEDETIGGGNNRKTTLRRFTPIKDDTGKLLFVMGFGIDITDRKNTELSLTHSLAEKEVLLKEVHHRVKNNLTVIYSMLQLAADGTENAEVKGIFSSSQLRVRSMALVHESLYRSNIFSILDIVAYANRLFNEIAGIYTVKDKALQMDLSDENIPLDIDDAVTMGMILNELIMNFFKYVYPVTEKPWISLRFATVVQEHNGIQEKYIQFTYRDNGPGFNKEKSGDSGNGIGPLLLDLLAMQLKGKTTQATANGLTYSIQWKCE